MRTVGCTEGWSQSFIFFGGDPNLVVSGSSFLEVQSDETLRSDSLCANVVSTTLLLVRLEDVMLSIVESCKLRDSER